MAPIQAAIPLLGYSILYPLSAVSGASAWPSSWQAQGPILGVGGKFGVVCTPAAGSPHEHLPDPAPSHADGFQHASGSQYNIPRQKSPLSGRHFTGISGKAPQQSGQGLSRYRTSGALCRPVHGLP